MGFQGHVNQNTLQHKISALKYFFTIILLILTTFIKISQWGVIDILIEIHKNVIF